MKQKKWKPACTAFLLSFGVLCVLFCAGVAFYNTYTMLHGEITPAKLPLEGYVHTAGSLLYRVLPSELKVLATLLLG